MSNIDKRELLGVQKHANQHRLSRLTMEVHTDELRIMASAVESYTDELIAALEAAEKRIAELREWNLGLAQESFTHQQRIAELEARTVNLPKRSVGEVMHMSGFSRDYAGGWCAGNDNAIHEIRAAGIGKGE